jgi:cytochrome c oxidase subunit II
MQDNGNLFMPSGHSTIAPATDALFNFIYYVSIVFFAIVVGMIVLSVLRYRRRGRSGLSTGPTHNTKLEIAWTVIPLVLVMIVFAWGFKSYLRLFVIPKDAMEIKVTGQRWFWSFDYPSGAKSVNELVVPVGKPIKLLLSSKDVIHSFFVPNFRIKMDVVPNRYTMTWFEATDTGAYDLFCSEYCGTKHSSMIGKIKVVTEREYADWMESNSKAGEGMSLSDYGASLYQSKACITCHSVDGKAGTGPTFLGLFGETVKFEDGTTAVADENYLRACILTPNQKVLLGYQPVMPTFQGVLDSRQIDALIAYIKSLNKGGNKP